MKKLSQMLKHKNYFLLETYWKNLLHDLISCIQMPIIAHYIRATDNLSSHGYWQPLWQKDILLDVPHRKEWMD